VVTGKDFLQFKMTHNCDGVEMQRIDQMVYDELESFEAVEYTKSLITEL